MESNRKKIAGFLALGLFLLTILVSWYGTLNEPTIVENSYRDDLSKDEKISRFGFTSVDKYDAYYQQTEVIRKTKTFIPFVYEKDYLQKTPVKLFTVKK